MQPIHIFAGSRVYGYWPARMIIGVLIALLLPACAIVKPQTAATEQIHGPVEKLATSAGQQHSYWWFVTVKIAWPEDQEPAWYMDSMLARQVFRPLLLEHALDIEMWRFHRRAGRDNSGHQLSFLFYAKRPIAEDMLRKVTENSFLQRLIEAGKVDALHVYDLKKNKNPSAAIESTSDPNWSLEMQRAWPYYAMGVSQLWLSLIDQYIASARNKGENLPDEKNIEQLDIFYRHINEQLNATWENEGGHALLHHLNALFGYGEVFVYERRLTRF